MKPKTIHHPEALADWRAIDEDAHSYLSTVQEQINIGRTQDELDNNTIPKEQTKLEGLLARRLEDAIEQETRKRGEVRKEREA